MAYENARSGCALAAAVIILTSALVTARQAVKPPEYFRNEQTFLRGIKLFPFEVHDDDYVKVVYNELGYVREMNWHTREDNLLKRRTYEYWSDDHSVKRMVELTPDSLILREVLFGDEPKSRQLIGYLYDVEGVPDFRNRFTEVFYDSTRRVAAYRVMSTQGRLIGAVFLDYDSLGYLTGETWFEGPQLRPVRVFRYIFHRDTGEQEVIERGREGQIISHLRIQAEHPPAPFTGAGEGPSQLENLFKLAPSAVPPDSGKGGELLEPAVPDSQAVTPP